MKQWALVLGVSCIACAIGACSSDSGSGAPTVGTGRVIGRIEIADGLPAASCLVALPGVARAGRCAPDGSFDIDGVAAGKRALQIVLDPDSDARIVIRRIVPVAVNPGFISDTGALRVLEAGSIGGRITAGGSAPPFSIISVPGFGAVTAATDKGYLLPVVPPGKHTVVLTTSEGGQTSIADVEVTPGQTTAGVDFNLSGIIKGNVDLLGQAKREGKADDKHGGLTVEVLELRDGKVVESATTQSDGAFTVNVPRGNYAVRVSDENNPIKPTLPYVLVHGEEPVALSYPIVVPSADGDLDGDGVVNADDDDIDGDGVPNDKDALPHDPFEVKDADKDGLGDRADLRSKGGDPIDNVAPTPDTDGDGKLDFEDNCKDKSNPQQQDRDGDNVGDACDNCPGVANADQIDSVGDGTGDKCRVCIQGTGCAPANPCHEGRLTCTGNGAVCSDIGTQRPNGTPCGNSQVCNNGKCDICRAGEKCPPTKAGSECNVGTVRCDSGLAVCEETQSPAPDGTICGADKVCFQGSCQACKSGDPCDPATLCRQGRLSCSSGQPQCTATQLNKPDGTSCGTDLVCNTGSCVKCQQGQSCQPTAKPCNAGTLDCSSGTPSCVDAQTPAPDGTPCGNGMFCQAGTCTTLPNTLTVVSGDNQTAPALSKLATVTLELKDGNGKALAGETVDFIAPPGASISPTSATTNLAGRVTVTPHLGPATGAQAFSARSASAGTINISATATALPSGKVQVIINKNQSNGTVSGPTPAIDAAIGDPQGIAVASDGTIYLSDGAKHKVLVIRPDGVADVLAGSSTGFSGDFGPAKDAKLFYPAGLALDEPNKLLYVADSANQRVRVIDLATPAHIIRTVAGGSIVGPPGYGDGGAATVAQLRNPRHVAIGPNGALYIAETLAGTIRRVDLQNNVISTIVAAGNCGSEVTLWSCGTGCAMAWNQSGDLFFSGEFCGGPIPNRTGTIVRRDSSGTLHVVAGGALGGATTPGRDARATDMDPGWIAFDGAGNLLYSDRNSHVVRRIDGRTHVVAHVAGTFGQPGQATPLADAATSPLRTPAGIAFIGSDLLIADTGNFTVRRVPMVSLGTPTPAQLTLDSGDNQTPTIGRLTAAALKVKVTGGGSPLAGTPVQFKAQDLSVALTATTAPTAADGVAAASAWVGIAPGNYTVEASTFDIHGAHLSGSPKTFTINAQAPAAGTIFSVGEPAGNHTELPAFAPLASMGTPHGVVVGAAGTFYASFDARILRFSPRGIVDRFSGDSGGDSGDNGPILAALFRIPGRLFFDAAKNDIYVVDTGANRIRRLDLASGIISAVAGGGTLTVDNIPATQALLNPTAVVVDQSGGVYISDQSRLRYVDPASKLIRTVVSAGACSGSIAFSACASNDCPLASDGAGGVYIGARICGTSVGQTGPGILHGILRVSSTGVITHIAGSQTGTTQDGVAATAYKFAQRISALWRDGNTLYIGGVTRVLKMTIGGTISTIAGTGTAGSSGDYGPATSAQLYRVNDLALLPGGHLVIADGTNRRLRIIW